ncbi:hypothetical protein L7F22_013562 [Adiantum nelumboides]|nr:hypothetical protein [Adiantum nelumboides]
MGVRKLVVEVLEGRNLMPKDGQGSSSAYVQIDFEGRRQRTQTKAKQLNPVWNEIFEFEVLNPADMSDECLELNVYNDKHLKRSKFLGRICICGSTFAKKGEEQLKYVQLEKKGLFSSIKGELGVKVYYYDEQPKPPEPEQKAEEKPAEAVASAEKSKGEEKAEDAKNEEQEKDESKEKGKVEKKQENQKEMKEKEEKQEKREEKAEEKKEDKKEEKKEEKAEEKNEEKKEKKKEEVAAAVGKKEGKGKEERKEEKKPEKKEGKKEVGKEEVKSQNQEAREKHPPMPAPAPDPADYSLKDTNPPLGGIHGEKICTYDLVEKMQYLYVRVVKARGLAVKDVTGSSDPYVKLIIGSKSIQTPIVPKNLNPEWNLVFAFGKDVLHGPVLKITVWDQDLAKKDDFLGAVWFDLQEIPVRVPPDSPLAPQWYRLEEVRGQGKVQGDIMLSVWMGTQADEAFSEAWISDTGGFAHNRSKVYLSPKLWYFRVNIIEAQDLHLGEKLRYPEVSVRVQLGYQVMKTRVARNRNTSSPFWNEDLLFVAAEPFDEQMLLTVEERVNSSKDEALGQAKVSLITVEKRYDHRLVASRWFDLEKSGTENGRFRGRIHLRLCFDGGYHVIDEAAYMSSDHRPTAKQLWKKPLGVLEIGILGAQSLLPIKTKDGRGSIDAYCVAKYGLKWVRTRTVMDSFQPRWNEQYTWEVYDPCTVLTVGVFDNSHMQQVEKGASKDVCIGKVRIRLSTLEAFRVYTNSYPLLVLHPSGAKRMGEVELAVRFSVTSTFSVMHAYTQPLLPKMHYLYPLTIAQQDHLRQIAMKMVAMRLARSEPPLKQEVVRFMLDTNSSFWSLRRTKANWYRIMSVLSPIVAVGRWLDDVCQWRQPVTSVLVHVLFLILVWFPELILPTVFLYMFLIGAWHYRFRPRSPSHMDARISHANAVTPDELDEEFDTVPSSKPPETIKVRYERLRALAGKIQSVLGDIASQGERVQALLSWRDPRATTIFIVFCLAVAGFLYVLPFRVAAVLIGLYLLRHPRFRHRHPPVALNFFRRLPSLSDRIL